MSSSLFLRALMTAVCKAAVKGEKTTRMLVFLCDTISWNDFLLQSPLFSDENTSCKVDTAVIQRHLPILHKYFDSDTERQLQALYALQDLIVALDQPPSA